MYNRQSYSQFTEHTTHIIPTFVFLRNRPVLIMAPTFMGGSLKLKGAKKKKKKTKHSKAEETVTKSNSEVASPEDSDDDLTMTEKQSLKRKKERESIELEKIAKQSHRERIEEFNEKLGSLTELNDIPRVSAAGNG